MKIDPVVETDIHSFADFRTMLGSAEEFVERYFLEKTHRRCS